MSPPAPNLSADRIDDTIQLVENLYQQLTGRPPPPGDGQHAPIPPEVDPATHVERKLERLVAEMVGPVRAAAVRWSPPVLAWEDEGGFVVTLDVPGIQREAIELSLGNGVLTISGERAEPWKRAARVLSVEHPLGRFSRTIPLPPRSRPDQISATLRDGVLDVRILMSSADLEHHNVPIRS
jgi:HSP20 family molecular chaperone IbpA